MASNNGVKPSLRAEVMRRGEMRCAHCGIQGHEVVWRGGGRGYHTNEPKNWLAVDHIVPRNRGGSSDIGNLQILCTRCNSRKGSRSPVAARCGECVGEGLLANGLPCLTCRGAGVFHIGGA